MPEIPTVMRTFGCTLRYISAAAVVHGPTVLEPSAAMLPESFGAFFAVAATAVTPPREREREREDPEPGQTHANLHGVLLLPCRFRWIASMVAASQRRVGYALVNRR